MENIFSLMALLAQEKAMYSGWMRKLLRHLGPNDESYNNRSKSDAERRRAFCGRYRYIILSESTLYLHGLMSTVQI